MTETVSGTTTKTVTAPAPPAESRHRLDPGPAGIDRSDASSHIPVPRLAPRRLKPIGALVAPVVVLVVWQITSSTGLLSPRQLSSPTTAITTAWDQALHGDLLHHFAASARRAYLGLAVGVVAGVVAAMLAGLTWTGEAAIDSLVQIKRAIPTLALIPLGILWLGIGESMKVALIALSVFIPIYINTHAGLRGIDKRYVELAQSLGMGKPEFLRRVALPGALPGFLTGLRLAVTMCWTALVVLEQINASQGIGYLMTRARTYGQTDIIVVGIVIYAVMGLVSDAVVRVIQSRALRYRKALGS